MKTSGTLSEGATYCLCLALVTHVLSPAAFAQAANPAEPDAVELLIVEGRVEVSPAGRDAWIPASANLALQPGDKLRTGKQSRAAIRSSKWGLLRIRESSLITIEPPRDAGQRPLFNLLKGFFYFFNRDKPIEVELQNRLASAATRGTEFLVAVLDDGRMEVTVLDGEVDLKNAQGVITLAGGQQGVAVAGQAPARRAVIMAAGVIQWCLYYPAVLDVEELGLDETGKSALAASLTAWRRGDVPRALQNYPENRQPASGRERVYRAALLLAVGETGQAESLLQNAGGAGPFADAIREMIAAAQFQGHARSAPPALATEWLAESYYLQSRATMEGGRLGEALKAAKAAVAKSPHFSFAWARVAELEFSFGRTDAALAALDNALRLAPRNAQALALKGFLLAAQNRISEALKLFDEAIATDGALANGWLGRGLCRIRHGKLAEGRADLLTAAALEPQRAVLRGYLGKAFSDSRDDKRARQELELAKKMDPMDPTSWLYSALNNQQGNRINDAIHDLEKSKELNDNRSLYRSGLLLDQDRAVRSANLARIYKDAGMDDVAYREAVRAVNSDYANYSAHLFLANSYNALRDPRLVNLRYESAENTEFLVANLLAPVGAGVLSPTVSQQEYSKLFERNRLGVISTTEYLSRGAWMQSGAQYGTFGDSSYSLEGFYRGDNGERPNSDWEQEQMSFQFKQQLTPEDSFYVQVSRFHDDLGDVAQRHSQRAFDPTFRTREHQDATVNVGYHHAWGPGVHTLFLTGYLPDRFELSSRSFPTQMTFQDWPYALPFGIDQRYHASLKVYFGEVQQIIQFNERHNTVFGARFQWGQSETESMQVNPTDFFPFFAGMDIPTALDDRHMDFHRWSGYVYHNWEIVDNFRLIAGLGYDHLDYPENFLYPPLSSETESVDRLLPKAGFVWTPLSDTTVRFAYARSVTGVSLEQSYRLEPAQVAGITQAYRGVIPETAVGGSVPGAPFDTYGFSIEQKFDTRTYVGLSGELLDSDFTRTVGGYYIDPIFMAIADPAAIRERLEYTEKSLTATVNQLVGRDWAFGVRYRLTQSDLQQQFTEVSDPARASVMPLGNETRSDSTLHQISLDAVFNHPCGFFARLNALWNQQNTHNSLMKPGDEFWQFNVMAGYRFLHRRVELSAGVLNITDQGYQLDALTPYNELPHSRTAVVRLLINF